MYSQTLQFLEAGQGTVLHAAAEVSHPVKQGLVQSFSVYVDTLFVCTAMAFMILFTGQFNMVNPDGGFIVVNLPGVAFKALKDYQRFERRQGSCLYC
jgi:AGCS family alanine or glycine:cation symporter